MNPFKKIINSCLLASLGVLLSFQTASFKSQQLKNSRVKSAYLKYWADLQALMDSKKINKENFSLYIRVFKLEGQLEIWVKNKGEKKYIFIKSFPICAKSGEPGPKRRQGDGQVPEGFYQISAFQPQSSYHLALKVGYPNKSDRLKATSNDPGGDIMIHGNCVTIGCIPIQDEPIEQLYILCVEAKNKGYGIYTDIYPFKFNAQNQGLQENKSQLTVFWNSLKQAYNFFETNKSLAKITTDTKGNYIIN